MLSGISVDMKEDVLILHNPNTCANQQGDSLFVVMAAAGYADLIGPWLNYTPDDVKVEPLEPLEKVTQDNINKGFKAAVAAGHFAVVDIILPHVDNLKTECVKKPGMALQVAVNLGRKDITKAILCERLKRYIQEQALLPVANVNALFAVENLDEGERKSRIEGARALINILNDESNYHHVILKHAAVRDGELAVLLSLIDACYLRLQTQAVVEEVKSETKDDENRCLLM